jgi:peptidoglycan/LPS O-acetylase OafA/YrhL
MTVRPTSGSPGSFAEPGRPAVTADPDATVVDLDLRPKGSEIVMSDPTVTSVNIDMTETAASSPGAGDGSIAAIPDANPEVSTATTAADLDATVVDLKPIATGPEQPAKAAWRAPGLDGVRALAVLAVLAFHEGLPWIPGGFLGVDIFFVLSGYLITDLLVARFRKDGRIGIGSFYQRRARRLLPALGLMVLIVTAAVAVLEPQQRGSLRPALLGAITYTSNWWQAFTKQSYFMRYGPPPPFEHLWSLAVEEQFYLIWPLVLVLVLTLIRRPGLRALVAWGGALASALLCIAVYVPGSDPSLVYYGTDTHASGLMIGAALALTWPLAKVAAAAGRVRLPLDIAGAAGLLVLGWACWHFSGSDPFVYPYGLVIASLAAGALVLAAAAPGRIGRLLSVPPLRWLGIRSYGIYLWHWPVIAISTGIDERSATTAPVRIIDALLPIALAAASWRWLEEPILRNGLRSELARRARRLPGAITIGWRSPAELLPLVPALALLAVGCAAGYGILHSKSGPTLQQQIARGAQAVAISNLVVPTVAQPFSQPNASWIRAVGKGPFRPGAPAHHQPALRFPGTRVIAIGDSVMLASAPELAEELPGIYVNAQVSRAMIAGVAIVQGLARDRHLRPVLVVGLGTNGPITIYQVQQLRAAIGDRWLILVNTFVPRPWGQEVNSTMVTAIRRFPNVLMVNWHAAIEHHTNLLWSDGIHPQPSGGLLYAKTVRAVVLRALSRHPELRWPKPKPAPPSAGFVPRDGLRPV